jgi:SPP1 family predicted phage head-tail adaptor
MPNIGDMTHRVAIYDRSIKAPTDDTGNYSLDFKKKIVVWASIETVVGVVIFDSVNMDKTITHKLLIRYLPFVTQEYWVSYKNNYYDIVKVEDLNEEKRFQILHCNLRGSQLMPANEA